MTVALGVSEDSLASPFQVHSPDVLVTEAAWSDEVLAPVSTLAVIGSSDNDGRLTRSRQPIIAAREEKSWVMVVDAASVGKNR